MRGGDLPSRWLITLSRRHPEWVDRFLAIFLSGLVCLQIAFFQWMPDHVRVAEMSQFSAPITPLTYFLALVGVAPLWWRQRSPGVVFAVVMMAAAGCTFMRWPLAFIAAGPLLAMYSLAARHGGRKVLPLAFVAATIPVVLSMLTFTVSFRVAQFGGTCALLGLSALLGDIARARRELAAEVARNQLVDADLRLEEERLRIAREVHDIMAHSLTLITVQADAGAASFVARPALAREALTTIGATGRSTLQDLRGLLDVLTHPEDDAAPRAPITDLSALNRLVDAVRETGLGVDVRTAGKLDEVPTVTAVSAYRIIQESLTNVVRHARARMAVVTVTVAADELRLEILDDGRGGSAGAATTGPISVGAASTGPISTGRSVTGRGLTGMAERVAAFGGTLEAGPEPGGGFQVVAVLPIHRGN